MRVTSAILMGVLVNSAISACLLATLEASSSALPQAQVSDKKTKDEQLLEAVRARDVEKTRALLQSGANANGGRGELPLVAAIDRNDTTIARILIEAGAKVNPCSDPNDAFCPLRYAAVVDRVEMVRLLLSVGANVNGAGPGSSPLWFALVYDRPEVARTLIAAGADWKAEKACAQSGHMPQVVKRLEKVLGPIPPPMTVEQVVNKLEGQWDSMDLGLQQQDQDYPTGADMAWTASELGSRLKAQPQDTQVLLSWARFALVPFPYKSASGYNPSAPETASLLAPDVALDRVLAAEPHNAEALYLKGRMYGGNRTDQEGSRHDDLGQAIPLLRRAVEFAPNNLRYREFLALFLADQGHPGEGKEILRAAQKNHPMIPFLEDLESLSAPEGGEFLTGDAVSMEMMIALGNAGVADHIQLRLRTYHYAKSPAEIEAFYASRIPGFRFIPEKEEPQGTPNSEGEILWMYLQFLRVKSGSMKPSSQRSELPDLQKAENGIMMTLVEMNVDSSLKRKLSPGEHSCYLILANYRR
jgi:hypothetical protein